MFRSFLGDVKFSQLSASQSKLPPARQRTDHLSRLERHNTKGKEKGLASATTPLTGSFLPALPRGKVEQAGRSLAFFLAP
jgi:hypothetical protein